MVLWRISNHRSLNGEGGLRASARWHTAGHRIVYLAESPAGALLEVLVHLELTEADLPASYKLLRVEAPDDVKVTEIRPPRSTWARNLALSRSLGDAWLRAGESPLARVPSAILPSTSNILFNPDHAAASAVRIASSTTSKFDPRLLRSLGSR